VTRTLVLTSALCVALLPAIFPFAAQAEPRVLTPPQLAAVTAGRVPVQINVNRTAQIARASAVSTAVCSGCTNATVTASSSATAFNVNAADLTNLAF
jgi:hypothetical protein